MSNPVKMILCVAKDSKYNYCCDANGIRAISKDEELLIKTCKCNTYKLGECPNQRLLDHIPRISIYYFKELYRKENYLC